MRIAVAGGTGTVGAHVVTSLEELGHEVRVLSRRSPAFPVDLTTGAGLAAALDGCAVVVDAANGARDTLVDGTRRLLAAGGAAGVAHHLCVSIVGCDLVPMGYYKIKTEQEATVVAGDVPWTIVRATQFHELVQAAFRRLPVLPVLDLSLQTVAAREVGAAVAEFAVAAPRLGRVSVAGPEVSSLRDVVRAYKRVTGRRAPAVPLWLPGKVGRALRAGALTTAAPDVIGKVGFEEWLRTR
jgi:uncharacterized protein YbjT (DUF2867 family)